MVKTSWVYLLHVHDHDHVNSCKVYSMSAENWAKSMLNWHNCLSIRKYRNSCGTEKYLPRPSVQIPLYFPLGKAPCWKKYCVFLISSIWISVFGSETEASEFYLWRNVMPNQCQWSRIPPVPSFTKKHSTATFILTFPNCRSLQLMCSTEAPGTWQPFQEFQVLSPAVSHFWGDQVHNDDYIRWMRPKNEILREEKTVQMLEQSA